MVTYPYEATAHYECADFDASGEERNRQISDAAVARVMAYEREHGRTAVEQDFANPGFDIESQRSDGNHFIEVKGLAGPWGDRGVPLSRRQFDHGWKHGKRFWLYVVEHSEDASLAKVWPIQDPVGMVSQFRFDHRWRAVSTEAAALAPTLEPRPGRWLQIGSEGPFEILRVMVGGVFRIAYVRGPNGESLKRVFRPDIMTVLPATHERSADTSLAGDSVESDGGQSG